MILSAPQIRESEEFTIKNEPILSIDLMERAGCTFTELLLRDVNIFHYSEIIIFCGPGNNGGDGLVIARYLSEIVRVKVVIANFGNQNSAEFAINFERIKDNNQITIINATDFMDDLMQLNLPFSPLIIDALFGIGLTKPLNGSYAQLVEYINSLNGFVISVDVPSGLFIDNHTPTENISVFAHKVYTFQFPKLAFFMPENQERMESFSVIDIGLLFPNSIQSATKCIDLEMCSMLINPPKKFAHKGEKGHGLLIAGSAVMPGAAILAATTAMRGGLGKLTVHAPQSVLDKLAIVVPEAIHSIDKNATCYSQFEADIKNYDAIAIGSGLGKDKVSASGTHQLLEMLNNQNPTIPMIIDADALNLISENPEWLSILPASTIITPHIREFERLAGSVKNDFERIEKVKSFSKKYNIIVILKGAHTIVALPTGELFFNMSGNSGLATAGSGDLLTGLLLSLLAQQYPPYSAALLSVFLHGMAADLAIEEFHSEESLIASDVPYYIGKAFKKLK